MENPTYNCPFHNATFDSELAKDNTRIVTAKLTCQEVSQNFIWKL